MRTTIVCAVLIALLVGFFLGSYFGPSRFQISNGGATYIFRIDTRNGDVWRYQGRNEWVKQAFVGMFTERLDAIPTP